CVRGGGGRVHWKGGGTEGGRSSAFDGVAVPRFRQCRTSRLQRHGTRPATSRLPARARQIAHCSLVGNIFVPSCARCCDMDRNVDLADETVNGTVVYLITGNTSFDGHEMNSTARKIFVQRLDKFCRAQSIRSLQLRGECVQ
ncbi:unnamed protein product, partial [Ectocarpus sp. 4 AP-2014]